MKALLGILSTLLAVMPGSSAQSSSLSSTAGLPNCAAACISSALHNSVCSPTNATCLCTNVSYQADVADCVESLCSVLEELATKNITETACGAPIRDRTASCNVLVTTLGSISAVLVAIRFFSKYYVGLGFGVDDYLIALALVAGLPSTVLISHGITSNGLGKDIWTLNSDQLITFFHLFYFMELTYFYEVALLKLSILFFYLRIFPEPLIRRLIWATIVFTALYGIAFILAGVFQCQPVDYFWNQWDGQRQGRCVKINALGWTNAAISIVIDSWMLGVAISQIIHLNMPWKKKVAVGLMLSVGTFVTIVSIYRLQYLVSFADSTNPTWDNVPVYQWSNVEINFGFICACMPSIRALLGRLAPRLIGTTNQPRGYHFPSAQARLRAKNLNKRDILSSQSQSENGLKLEEIRPVHVGFLSNANSNSNAGGNVNTV